MIHVFNSSLVSGPETLVLPSLATWRKDVHIVLLRETRIAAGKIKQVEDYIRSHGLALTVIDVRSRRDSESAAKLAEFIKIKTPEIVHAHDVKASDQLGRAAALIPNRMFSIVTTHHGVRARSGFLVRLYELFYSRFVIPKMDRVLVVCSEDQKRLQKRGINAEKIRLHLNGVTRPEVLQHEHLDVQNQIRQSWGVSIPKGTMVLGVVARLAAEKGHLFLFKTLQILRQKNPQLTFKILIFGVGPLEKQLQKSAQSMGLQDVVHFMGYRPGIGLEMAGFDAILSFSKAEGLPVNLIEAGWATTPVFARGVDGVLDLIQDRQSGRLFSEKASADEAAQALAEFLKDQNQQILLGQALQERVRKSFSSEAWLHRLHEIYQELASGVSL